MSFEIKTTPRFEKSAKVLSKRHRSLKSDLGQFIASLEVNPFQGDELTPGIRKIRMAIYDKADYSTVDVSVILAVIAELDL